MEKFLEVLYPILITLGSAIGVALLTKLSIFLGKKLKDSWLKKWFLKGIEYFIETLSQIAEVEKLPDIKGESKKRIAMQSNRDMVLEKKIPIDKELADRIIEKSVEFSNQVNVEKNKNSEV